MSSNLLKFRGNQVADARVIDSNTLVAQRLEALSVKMQQKAQEQSEEGFREGLNAPQVDMGELLCETEDGAGEDTQGAVIKPAAAQELERKALEEANAMLSDAQQKAQEILEQASQEKGEILESARKEGYQKGMEQAQKEIEKIRSQFAEKEKSLEAEYEEKIQQLEPQFIDHLTGIYEHIFGVDLSNNREIIEYLLTTALRKVENSRNFILHVSKDDYPYVSMRKQQILGGAAYGDVTMDIIEDITLSKNQCMIETENGIFDCSLGTQLTELTKKMKLLAYQSR